MSVGSVTSFSPGAGRSARRSVSIYDRLEDARERRAKVLSRQPGSPPSAKKPAPRPAKSKHQPLTEAATPLAPAALVQVEETSSFPATRWTIRGLCAALFILICIAIYSAEFAYSGPAPDFAPPTASLTPLAYGPPLLASISRNNDLAPAMEDPLEPSRAATGELPTVDPSTPATPGPVLQEIIERPVTPAANPGSLTILPAGLRPAERPRLTTLAQSDN